jgi:hypothetical protein
MEGPFADRKQGMVLSTISFCKLCEVVNNYNGFLNIEITDNLRRLKFISNQENKRIIMNSNTSIIHIPVYVS